MPFNEFGLFANNIGYDYIDNSTYYNIDDQTNDAEFDALKLINNKSNAINIYIVNNAVRYDGLANGYMSNELVIVKNYANNKLIAHEIGHCFDLKHTFQGTAYGTTGCAENKNGSNCTSCGDEVCDTPADDNNGVLYGYSPDFTNLMSYYINTRDSFTEGQATRIRQAFASSSVLQGTLSSSCLVPEITDISTLCFNTNNKTLTMINTNGKSVTWTVSPNVQVISSTATTITVKALNGTITGNAWVNGAINNTNMVIQENFVVGIPYGYSSGSIEVHPQSNDLQNLFLDNWTRMHLTNVGNYYSYNDWTWNVQYSYVQPSTLSNIVIKPYVTGYMTIKARRENESGNGPWVSKIFDVTEEFEIEEK